MNSEFLAEVNMPDDVKKARSCCLGKPLTVGFPNRKGIPLLPFGNEVRIIDSPGIGDIVHRADEVIPGMPTGQFTHPIFAAREIVHLPDRS
jgi:hypothetical protein